ncbi:MAG TPA: hypothetical protein VK784_13180 [Pseudonocardiaceae bacterium]|nr:hypothetical protein [Pseudonocardiaceae bacterium]
MLVTGSRNWVDVETICAALEQVWGNGSAVPLSGACPAVPSATPTSATPNSCGSHWGGPIERHPVDWAHYEHAAGY